MYRKEYSDNLTVHRRKGSRSSSLKVTKKVYSNISSCWTAVVISLSRANYERRQVLLLIFTLLSTSLIWWLFLRFQFHGLLKKIASSDISKACRFLGKTFFAMAWISAARSKKHLNVSIMCRNHFPSGYLFKI